MNTSKNSLFTQSKLMDVCCLITSILPKKLNKDINYPHIMHDCMDVWYRRTYYKILLIFLDREFDVIGQVTDSNSRLVQIDGRIDTNLLFKFVYTQFEHS